MAAAGHVPCGLVDTSTGLDDVLKRRSQRLRRRVSQSRRLAEADGLAVESTSAADGCGVALLLPEIRRIVTAAVAAGRPTVGLLEPLSRGVLGDPLQECAEDGRLAVHLLRIGGDPAAFSIAVRGADVLAGATLVHDPRFDRYSPGYLLIGDVVAGAHELGCGTLDLSIGRFLYKDRWADTTYDAWDLVAASSPALLAAIRQVARARRQAARLVGRWRRGWWATPGQEPAAGRDDARAEASRATDA